jgi:Protein of unknown function (DUF732)
MAGLALASCRLGNASASYWLACLTLNSRGRRFVERNFMRLYMVSWPWGRAEIRPQEVSSKRRTSLVALIVAATSLGGVAQTMAPQAYAAPAPEVEYLYDVAVRRHYNFPDNDAIGYGYRICDKVSQGESYAQIMGDVKSDITPIDEFAANYLVSYAVNLLCPAQIWQLRDSAAHYQPPGGVAAPDTYY